MKSAIVMMPEGLDEHQEAVWIDGFKAGVNWMYKVGTGGDEDFPFAGEEIVTLVTDDDDEQPPV